jgi:hypothetical protein
MEKEAVREQLASAIYGAEGSVEILRRTLLFMKARPADACDPIVSTEIESALITAIQGTNLEVVLTSLILSYEKSPARGISDIQFLFGAYRQWVHVYNNSILSRELFLDTVSRAYCQAALTTLKQHPEGIVSWQQIQSSLPKEAKRGVFSLLGTSEFVVLADCLNQTDVLDLLEDYLERLSREYRFKHRVDFDYSTLGCILRPCLTKWPIDIVCKILVKRPLDSDAARVIAKCLPNEAKSLFIRLVARLWGDQHSVLRGRADLHEYLTSLLLAALEGQTETELTDGGDQSAMTALSQGVAVCFDAADKGYRIRAMKVATSFSAIMGVAIHFDELKNLDSGAAAAVTKSDEAVAQDLESSSGSDSSESSELESLLSSSDSEEETATEITPAVKGFMTTYLRVCLQSKCLSCA